MQQLVIHPVGNKREIPAGIPPRLWLDELEVVAGYPDLSELAWVHPVMEYLSPDELLRFRAQALVWRQYKGEWPSEVAWWWPVRLARRRGDIPHSTQVVEAWIDRDGVLRCGFCDARWSANFDGSPHPNRCKLCDRLWLVVKDERETDGIYHH